MTRTGKKQSRSQWQQVILEYDVRTESQPTSACHIRRQSHLSRNPMQQMPISSRDINDKIDQDGRAVARSS
jgi:hypothetical protein